MNFALIIGFFVLLGPQTLWARGVPVDHIDSDVSNTISADDLQKIPLTKRNFDLIFNLPASLPDNRFAQADISGAQANLKSNLNYFSSPSFQQPANLDSAIKDYLSHAPQDTQQMISKLDYFKSNPRDFFGGYQFSGMANPRSWSIYPQEMPKYPAFTRQEQTWANSNIPFGRLGLSKENKGWSYGLSTYSNNNWQWTPSFKLGESLGINGPIIAYGKTPQGPGLSIYAANGDFVGDITKTKLNYDPYVTSKYLLKANYHNSFGPSFSYDRTIPIFDFQPKSVIILPYGRGFGDNFQTAYILNNRLLYSSNSFEDDDDCDDDEYYYYHEEECDDDYDNCVPPYRSERIYPRSILSNSNNSADQKDPNDPLFPNPKPKKKTGGGSLMSGLFSLIAPTGPVMIQDTSSPEGVNVIDQYSLPQIGFTNKSDPNSAWNALDSKGPNVLVAVIDTGLDLTHPDGPEFIWQNPADGTHGWNFLEDNTDLKDERGHGTMVAGIIAAKTNNGIGMAGINAGAVIMPLKVADKKGNTNSLNIYRAIHYAVDHGAKIINISLGALGVSKLEDLAINYARSHNVLVVIASGNTRDDISTYGPSSSGSAMAVGALNYDGTLATVSNWGANNSLMAPGEQIFSLHSKDAPWDGPAGQRERLYTKESGTSFSAPMVAAAASLLLVKDPNLTADQLESLLLSSAKPLDKNRWTGLTGAGLLDAAKALRADPQDSFIVKITGIKKALKDKSLDHVDVYATVRGAVDYFTVGVGRGKYAHDFKTVIGISAQQANDDLVAHIPNSQLRGSNDWVLQVHAVDQSGKEYEAHTSLTLK